MTAGGVRCRLAGRRRRTATGARGLSSCAVAELGGLDVLVNAASGPFDPEPFERCRSRRSTTVSPSRQGQLPRLPGRCTTPPATAACGDDRGRRRLPALGIFRAHCVAKAGQAMLTRVLAKALAPEVRVVGVAPGPSRSTRPSRSRGAAETVLGRVGSAGDVAEAVLYLARARFVTGTSLVVDGGRLLQTASAT